MGKLDEAAIQALMDKVNKRHEKQQLDKQGDEESNADKRAHPLSHEGFLKYCKLDMWPMPVSEENLFSKVESRDMMGSADDIAFDMRMATPVDMKMLRDLDNRLDEFDAKLKKFADLILISQDKEKEQLRNELPLSIDRAFITDLNPSDAVLTHPSRKKKILNHKDKILESRQNTVEHCEFTGFIPGELIELPGNIEAPQILHRVTKAQEFNTGFKRFWKKIFQSEASIAMMQDTFWWIFIELFQKENEAIKADQGRLFDRISDSFVALFNSVNPEIKDKVFMVYADCLAQAEYVAYLEAFPESQRYFKDTFKQFLCNITSEWVSGMKAAPQSFSRWNFKMLESKGPRSEDDTKQKLQTSLRDSPEAQLLGTDDFVRMVERLGNQSALSRIHPSVPPARDNTMMTMDTAAGGLKHTGKETGRARKSESSVMGPGPEMERIMFNLQGRSPLVAHFLHMRQLQANQLVSTTKKVRRTEVAKMPASEQPTYQEVIENTLFTSRRLHEEYEKVCDMTQQEILRIEKQQRSTNRKIEKLQKELLFCKNSLEVKVMSERILSKQETTDTPGFSSDIIEEDED